MVGMNPHNMQMNMAQMSRRLPPRVLKQIGGPGAIKASCAGAQRRQIEGMKQLQKSSYRVWNGLNFKLIAAESICGTSINSILMETHKSECVTVFLLFAAMWHVIQMQWFVKPGLGRWETTDIKVWCWAELKGFELVFKLKQVTATIPDSHWAYGQAQGAWQFVQSKGRYNFSQQGSMVIGIPRLPSWSLQISFLLYRCAKHCSQNLN